MASFKRLPRLLRGRRDIRTDVDDEIETHIEQTIRALIATGLDETAHAPKRTADLAMSTRRGAR